MRSTDFDYELPPELVAQVPAERRELARLCVHERASGTTTHSRVSELGRWLRPGDLLVTNDTRVLPARLLGRRASGGKVELLLCEEDAQRAGVWTAFAKPASLSMSTVSVGLATSGTLPGVASSTARVR